MTPAGDRAPARWRLAGVVLFAIATFLLLTMGAAIIAAPVTVPLLFLVVYHWPTRVFRVIGAVLVGATVAEVLWAITYVTIAEAKPWIWLVPLAAAIAAGALLVNRSQPRLRQGAIA